MAKKIKTACEQCENRKGCPTMDKARETACKDFKEKEKEKIESIKPI